MSENQDVDGCYPGTTENMTKVGSRNGVAILECDHCGERVPKNWGNAKRHTCGRGAEVDGVGCCDDPRLVDHWVTHDDDGSTSFQERKKKCQTCGRVHPLEVEDRAKDSELVADYKEETDG